MLAKPTKNVIRMEQRINYRNQGSAAASKPQGNQTFTIFKNQLAV